MNVYFENVKKNFGFGCMRLPMKDGEIDRDKMCRMVDTFLENGFNYFDTAHGYLGGKSETALRECLVKRHPRNAYVLTNKLSTHFFNKQEQIRPLQYGVNYNPEWPIRVNVDHILGDEENLSCLLAGIRDAGNLPLF